MLHLASNVADVYDRVEAYEVCGEELREAYVGLKRLCTVWCFSSTSYRYCDTVSLTQAPAESYSIAMHRCLQTEASCARNVARLRIIGS